MEHKRENETRRDPSRVTRKASAGMWIGVAVLIILLLAWLSVAMFTGDTDVNLITPFPWV